jgi:hypothetical protein
MADANEQAWAGIWHAHRSAKKKRAKVDPLADQREAFRKLQQAEQDRFSIYPPGWNGEEW